MSTPDDQAVDDERDRWSAFIDERKTLFQTAKEASDQYSKAILTLAGGSLALSITFIEKVAPSPTRGSLWFLGFAWASYAFSMLVTTTSFLLAQFAYMRQIDISQAALLDQTGQSVEPTNPYVPWMKRLDLSGLILFALGLALTLTFATINLGSRANVSAASKPAAAPQSSP